MHKPVHKSRKVTTADPGQDDPDELDAYIEEMVSQAPPLSKEQRDTLALLLRQPRPP
jgi:hypothetical protein